MEIPLSKGWLAMEPQLLAEAHISGFYRSLRKKLLDGDELEALVGA